MEENTGKTGLLWTGFSGFGLYHVHPVNSVQKAFWQKVATTNPEAAANSVTYCSAERYTVLWGSYLGHDQEVTRKMLVKQQEIKRE